MCFCQSVTLACIAHYSLAYHHLITDHFIVQRCTKMVHAVIRIAICWMVGYLCGTHIQYRLHTHASYMQASMHLHVHTYRRTDRHVHIEYIYRYAVTHMNMYSCSHALHYTTHPPTHPPTHQPTHHTHMHTHTVSSGYNLTHTCASDACPQNMGGLT